MPRTTVSREAGIVALSARLVMKERIVKRAMGMVFFGAVPGATVWLGLSATR